MEFSFIRRVVAKLRILARPKKLIKMMTPYGAVRIYQKLLELKRAREQEIRESQTRSASEGQRTESAVPDSHA